MEKLTIATLTKFWLTILGIAVVFVCVAWFILPHWQDIPACSKTASAVRSDLRYQANNVGKERGIPIDEGLFVGDALEGTFLQLNAEHCTWSIARWKEELTNLRRIGLRTLIIQWVQYGDTDFMLPASGDNSPLQRIASAADECHINLFVGLSLSRSWWDVVKLSADTIIKELANNTQAADRVYALLKSHKSFHGWYIPHEVTDLYYTAEQQRLIVSFFRQLTNHLKRLDPLKPVIAAGYTNQDESTLSTFVTWWAKFLNEAGVDILVFQDGVGIPRQTPWRNILPLIEALVALDDNFSGDIWLLTETFSQIAGRPINDQEFRAIPADFGRIREQLVALGHYRKRLIAYSYFDYMRPSASKEASRLYDAYRRYVEEKAAQTLRSPISATGPTTIPSGTR